MKKFYKIFLTFLFLIGGTMVFANRRGIENFELKTLDGKEYTLPKGNKSPLLIAFRNLRRGLTLFS